MDSRFANTLLCSYLLCCTWLAPKVFAEEPTIESLEPIIFSTASRESAAKIKLEGSGFATCRELVFYESGVRCTEIQRISEYEVLASLEFDEHCTPGSYPFRVRTDFGFSDLKLLTVTSLPLVSEFEAAAKVLGKDLAFPCTLYGNLEEAEYDEYRIHLAEGQRLGVDVHAVRLGLELLDCVLEVYSPAGKLIARSDDSASTGPDPCVNLIADAEGEFTLRVYESNYAAIGNGQYAVHVGEFPCGAVAYPPFVTSVAASELSLLTQEGQAADIARDNVLVTTSLAESPHEAPKIVKCLYQEDSTAMPASFQARQIGFPCIGETEDNQTPEGALEGGRIQDHPVAFYGKLDSPADVDWFAFQAEKGQKLIVQTFADQIGSPADTKIEILDPAGNLISSNDDFDSHDSRVEFRVPFSANFLVRVYDKLGQHAPNAVYGLEVREFAPSVDVFLPRPDRLSQEGQSLAVPAGNRSFTRVGVTRTGIDGAAMVSFANLPSGVSSSPVIVPESEFWMPLVLEAAPDSPTSGGLVEAAATVRSENNQLEARGSFAQEVDLVAVSADRLFQGTTVRNLAVAVTPGVPFKIDLAPLDVALPIDGSIDVPLKITRAEGFDEPLLVTFPFLPPWVTCEPKLEVAAGQNEVRLQLKADPHASTGTWPFLAVASLDARNADTSEYEELVDREVCSSLQNLTIADTPFVAKLRNLTGEQGSTLQISLELEVEGDNTPADMEASLVGLPNRIASDTVALKSSDKEIQFEVQLPSDAPLGSFSGIRCRLEGKLAGQSIRYEVARDSVLTIFEPGQMLLDENGEVMSRLDSLRARQTTIHEPKE